MDSGERCRVGILKRQIGMVSGSGRGTRCTIHNVTKKERMKAGGKEMRF